MRTETNKRKELEGYTSRVYDDLDAQSRSPAYFGNPDHPNDCVPNQSGA